MKKELTEKNRFDLMRAFALTSFFCTIILAIVLFVESAMPGDDSAKQSIFLSEGIKNVVNVNDNEQTYETSRIVASELGTRTVGSEVQIKLTLYPTGATDGDVTYTSSDPDAISVDENGLATFRKFGSAIIEIVLKSNPKVKATVSAVCAGSALTNDTRITKLHLSQFDGTPRYGTVAQPITVKEGESLNGCLYDDMGNVYLSDMFKAEFDKSMFTRFYGAITAVKAGETSIRFVYDNEDTNIHVSSPEFPIIIEKDNNFVIPQQFEYDAEVHFGLDERIAPYELVRTVTQGAAAPSVDNIAFYLKNNDGCLTALSALNLYETTNVGKATIEISSRYNPDCKALIAIIVDEPIPTALRIVGNDRVAVDSQYSYAAYGDSSYIGNVTWNIVKGKGTVEDGGLIRPTRLGKMTIRVTSNADPSVYAEMTVTVSLFDNFQLFVRKIIGHFGLFVVLGIGLATSLFMLLKPRWLYAVISPVLGFLSALLSEALQLPTVTTGRYASWTDVGIDFVGSLVGIVLTTVVMLIYIAIRKRSATYPKTRAAFNDLTLLTAFKKHQPPSCDQ